MAALPYMPFYPADYLADTRHLSTTEHGAYLLLILSYWNSGKPLPDNDARLSRLAGLSAGEWAAMRGVLAEFFEITNSEWRHKRIDRDLAAINAKVEKARASAQKRWQSADDANADANGYANADANACADAIPYQNQNQNQKSSTNVEQDRISSADAVMRVFEAWNGMAEQVGLARAVKLTDKRKASIRARLKDFDAATICSAISRIPESSFLMGGGDRGWKADFDFVLQPSSLTKLIEGAYHGRTGKRSAWLDA